MVELAKRIGMDAIVTRNEKDYTASPVAVYLPDGLFALLISEGEYHYLTAKKQNRRGASVFKTSRRFNIVLDTA
ncbi:MAG: hypothetical protein IJ788_05770 [Oscillospiraceae bacterium]|nr:hypothetical protein [Oscillospiraceae bacterium]